MRKIHNVEQKSEEWYALRRQYPLTASEAQAIGNNGKGLETLIMTKLSEKYSSGEAKNFSNKDTDRGNELEPIAAELYELKTENKVQEIGFVTDDEISKVGGASPDRLVIGNGLAEIKSLEDKNYFEALIEFKKTGTFKVDPKHDWQMNMQMLFTGTKWCDYVLFNPNYSPSLLIQRVLPDPEKIDKILEGLAKGEKIISDIEANLK